jgi:hypothetical protein
MEQLKSLSLMIIGNMTGMRHLQPFREVLLGSNDIAEARSHSDEAWREELKAGDNIDAYDDSKIWYQSTIQEIKEVTADERTYKQAYVGFRVYSPDAQKIDDEGRRFAGWSNKFDKWIPLYNTRIQPFKSFAKKWTGKGSPLFDDKIFDDSVDVLMEGQLVKPFAVTRPKKCKSLLLVKIINIFGEVGAIDIIVKRMQDKEDPLPLETFFYYMDILGKIWALLFREYAKKIIPQINEAVHYSLLNAPEQLLRNVRRERIEGIIKSHENLLRRTMDNDDR